MAQIDKPQRHIIKKGDKRPYNVPIGSTLSEYSKDLNEKVTFFISPNGNDWYEKEPEDADLIEVLLAILTMNKLLLNEVQGLKISLAATGLVPLI